MAAKRTEKIEAQVVEAIRRLQTVQGSTPREISSYIAQEYNIPGPQIRKHVQLALKRGVTYGILQRLKGGYYTCNQDLANGFLANSGDANVEIPYRSSRIRSRCTTRGRRGKRRGRSRRRGKSRGRKRSRRGRRKRYSRRRRSKRRSRPELPKEIDEFESAALSKPSKSNTFMEKESLPSNHSTISGHSDERQE